MIYIVDNGRIGEEHEIRFIESDYEDTNTVVAFLTLWMRYCEPSGSPTAHVLGCAETVHWLCLPHQRSDQLIDECTPNYLFGWGERDGRGLRTRSLDNFNQQFLNQLPKPARQLLAAVLAEQARRDFFATGVFAPFLERARTIVGCGHDECDADKEGMAKACSFAEREDVSSREVLS